MRSLFRKTFIVALLFAGSASAQTKDLDTPDVLDCPGPILEYAPPPAAPAGDRIRLSAEYLFWFIEDAPVPVPLATTGPAPSLGLVGTPGVRTLIGEQNVSYGMFSGMRANAEYWLQGNPNLGLDVSGFFLEKRGEQFRAVSPSGSLLARPFGDSNTGMENVKLLGFPGAFTGGVVVDSTAQLWGIEANAAAKVIENSNISASLIAGFRYLELTESLGMSDLVTVGAGGVSAFGGAGVGPGSVLVGRDQFDTRNQFYGGQLGGRITVTRGRFGASVLSKVALGTVRQHVNTSGSTTLLGGGTLAGDLLALSSNIGGRSTDRFAVIPEVGVNFFVDLTENIRILAGYTFLYINEAARPGDQIDRTANPTLIPVSPTFGVPFGPQRPAAMINSDSFTAHGANFGLLIKF